MNRLSRVRAVLWTDLLIRIRKPSSAVSFLLLCFVAYAWVPDPSTGRALMTLDGQRVLYNAPAMAFATALLCALFVALFGFYLVSRSVSYDLTTRCGQVIAATTTSNWEYLTGKCLGNIAFLSVLSVGYMFSSIAMQAVRGEAPIEIGAYLTTYLILLPPPIVFVSCVAVLFQAVSVLSGKFGDVLYFFLWGLLLGTSIVLGGPAGGNPAMNFDFTGMALVEQGLSSQAGSQNFTIGATPFQPELGVRTWTGIELPPGWLSSRLVSILAATPLLLLATFVFRRFDPTKTQAVRSRQGKGWLERLNQLTKPVSRLVGASLLMGLGRGRGFAGAVISDAALTLQNNPLGGVALLVTAVVSALLPATLVAQMVMPVSVVALAVLVAGVSTRERRAGTGDLVRSIPGLDRRFLLWKFSASLFLGLGFTAIAALKLAVTAPSAAMSLLCGTLFVAAAATSVGIVTGSPRAFLILFLSFWYLVINDGGSSPSLDFAGFYGGVESGTRLLYLALASALLAIGYVAQRLRVR